MHSLIFLRVCAQYTYTLVASCITPAISAILVMNINDLLERIKNRRLGFSSKEETWGDNARSSRDFIGLEREMINSLRQTEHAELDVIHTNYCFFNRKKN